MLVMYVTALTFAHNELLWLAELGVFTGRCFQVGRPVGQDRALHEQSVIVDIELTRIARS